MNSDDDDDDDAWVSKHEKTYDPNLHKCWFKSPFQRGPFIYLSNISSFLIVASETYWNTKIVPSKLYVLNQTTQRTTTKSKTRNQFYCKYRVQIQGTNTDS